MLIYKHKPVMAALKAPPGLLAAAATHCAAEAAEAAFFRSPISAGAKERGFGEGITCSPSFWTGTPSAAESRVKEETERGKRGKTHVY